MIGLVDHGRTLCSLCSSKPKEAFQIQTVAIDDERSLLLLGLVGHHRVTLEHPPVSWHAMLPVRVEARSVSMVICVYLLRLDD